MNKGRVGGKGARPPRVRSRARVTFPRSAHAQCANGGEARAARAGALGAPGVRGRGGGGGGDGGATGDSDERRPSVTAMYRHVTATVSAAVRLRPGRAWAPAAAAAPGSLPPRRRYRARPQDLEPPVALPLLPPPPCPQVSPGSVPRGLQGLGGPVTTVDGRREDDIDVRDPPRLLLGPPGPPPGTPGTPPGRGHNPPSMEEHLASMHEKLRHELPNFFLKVPDYGLYAPDVEFQCHHLHLHTRSYDALSTFFLNSQGLIRCHRVDKLMPAPTAVPEPKKLLVASALAVALARP
ncbi:uncharacterized protein FYW23_015807 isoform 3-T3 [Sylvia borin]